MIYGLDFVASYFASFRNATQDFGGSDLWPPKSVAYTRQQVAAGPAG